MVLYGTDISLEGTRNPAADRIQYVVMPLSVDAEASKDLASISADFEVWRKNGSWAIWKRRGVSS